MGSATKYTQLRDRGGARVERQVLPGGATEVVTSRILWGVGYHQPPVYTLERWTAEGALAEPAAGRALSRRAARPPRAESRGPWAYDDNPFVGTRPLTGLLVLQAMLGNSDLKPTERRLQPRRPVEGARQWYVARDLGQRSAGPA